MSNIELKILSKTDSALLDQVETLWRKFYDGMSEQGLLLPLIPEGEKVWRRTIESSLGRTNYLVVALSDVAVIGFALGTLRIAPEYLGGHLIGFVSGLYVHPDFRKTKIGTNLYEILEIWFAERKAHSYELQVVTDNEAAINFWKGLDYHGELYQMRKKPGNNR